ncbi:hypothetical protein IB229_18265 [Pseudomonas sp. PDM14]|uniref:hypothetical protein n=1 Tax=Pseudomonas sp. PDM14 TaxID=2769288 RepID=UPI001781E1F5|nr:hypothetical protein [Pseudomonas sp. PDM14]MBD9484932.1 hypothetical protein [Pseudomonas sp. PDM14]
MSEQSVLSSEELDFIQHMFDSPLIGKRLQIPTFNVDGDPRGNALLSALAQNAQLSLDARFDGYWMSFPVQMIEDELHNLQLELGAPSIFEEGAVQRPLRLHLETPLPLLDDNARPSDLQVQQISPNGLLVSGAALLPVQFDLWLPLPEQDAIAVRGRLVRLVAPHQGAYVLRLRHAEHAERLRQFIFEQHRRQHPELQLPR